MSGQIGFEYTLQFRACQEKPPTNSNLNSYSNNPAPIATLHQIDLLDYAWNSGNQEVFVVGSNDKVENHLTFWNGALKECTNKYNPPGSICCGTISPCGRFLAYGIGETWDKGVHGLGKSYIGPRVAVHVLSVGDFLIEKFRNVAL